MMKQRLCVGIHKLNPEWEQVLEQAGIWFEKLDYSSISTEQYSVIILNGNVGNKEKNALSDYVQKGGALLEAGAGQIYYSASEYSRKKHKTVINTSENPAFAHIPFIDIYAKAATHWDSSILNGLIHFKPIQQGVVAFLGLNVPALLNARGYERRRFFNPTHAYADEIVSKTGKAEIVHVFEALLRELHSIRKLTYIKKWTSPAERPVFCFRIDSDYGDKDSINALYKLIRQYKIPATWFLHVQAHEPWLGHFKQFEDQEIALHGYEHAYSRSATKNFKNIEEGLTRLRRIGIEVSGYCAPYGIWSKGLARGLSKFDFTYSSEFTFAYDGWPQWPGSGSLPLQIPVHPICTGSMQRKNLSEQAMETYFHFIINNKAARFEPVLFYHHPLQSGLMCWEHIFKRVNAEKYTKLTFADFATFWKHRRAMSFQAFAEGDEIEIRCESAPDLWLQISSGHAAFHLTPARNSRIQLSQIPKFEYSKQYLPEPGQVEEMRTKDFKLIKSSLLDWKNRNRL